MTSAPAGNPIRMAFIPLLDAAPLVAAVRLGMTADEGLAIHLERETSWATVRDRIAVGHLDAAHMLAPMPIAANLGLSPLPVRLVAPMALGFGGNTVTISARLSRELQSHADEPWRPGDARQAGRAVARLAAARVARGEPRLVIAVVHTHSAHYYQLAYWLAAVGLSPLDDVEIVVVPPSLTAAALAAGQIDAFCAGEPWGTVAVRDADARILLTNTSIWRSPPEKVLGMRAAWLAADPERASALVRAVHRGAVWCDAPANSSALAELLAEPAALGLPRDVLTRALARRFADDTEAGPTGFLSFANRDAAFPWLSHAAWFYSQMVRWRQTAWSEAQLAVATSTYRPDLFRAALGTRGWPSVDTRIEGVEDGPHASGPFFDGRVFDPARIPDYLRETGG